VLLVVGLAACGDDDAVNAGSGDGTTVTTADAGSDTTLAGGQDEEGPTVEAKDFSLTSISVAPGTEVTFENYGEKPHTMTADDGAFDAGRVEPGAKTTITAPSEPGDYPFHCEIHPAMTGTLTVEG
jgi:plastocyanin